MQVVCDGILTWFFWASSHLKCLLVSIFITASAVVDIFLLYCVFNLPFSLPACKHPHRSGN